MEGIRYFDVFGGYYLQFHVRPSIPNPPCALGTRVDLLRHGFKARLPLGQEEAWFKSRRCVQPPDEFVEVRFVKCASFFRRDEISAAD